MTQPATRRALCRLIAGVPLLAARLSWATEAPKLGRLIADAQASPKISQRIETISRALLGARYQAHTLIGGPRQKEIFVAREDAFDCVTYCEFVLAAAMARDVPEFEAALRKIRYHDGQVEWRERNHYFADWCRNNVGNGVCGYVAVGDTVKLDKSSNSEPGLGRRHWTLDVTPQAALLSNAAKLATGDIVGFVSRRANLDYSHTGFVAFGRSGELLLRHASSTRRRVIDERMEHFVAVNGVRYVTVLRPREPQR